MENLANKYARPTTFVGADICPKTKRITSFESMRKNKGVCPSCGELKDFVNHLDTIVMRPLHSLRDVAAADYTRPYLVTCEEYDAMPEDSFATKEELSYLLAYRLKIQRQGWRSVLKTVVYPWLPKPPSFFSRIAAWLK